MTNKTNLPTLFFLFHLYDPPIIISIRTQMNQPSKNGLTDE